MDRTRVVKDPADGHAWRAVALAMAATTWMVTATATGADGYSAQRALEQWQLRRLNAPTDREKVHEHKGHVYIYDGLTDREVDHPMDRHFDRIE